MNAARVSHQNLLLMRTMARLPICRAPINGVLIVEALAHRVEFDHLIAHVCCSFSQSSQVLLWLKGVGKCVSRAVAEIVGSRLAGSGKVVVVVVRCLTYIPGSMSRSRQMWSGNKIQIGEMP